ncbi:hypothetical protein ESY86_19980 [Subsaximicrobium wynnwilliamsii]|uniref:DUF6705 domain-containing protein n=1 Tax=Subsaximicrobium wynnwilliamsii TaxID=291179 RepID=A0A5C6ZCY0_9FLAO|nr:DUF6705 family protein [Subsaximicrobium wynnwilliamsii]TXD80793.1 hypothetical protein ESY87_20150 [Subsaximicrobium wynnwilliamsii]TXD86531.1 hypothetical protein ESY86_19980 [Subsaximicrobium wynnwilliamsii]TXE00087.1 hypothetical protein ESY88_20090 [Subsaximicrobium wynnwilliamsii]
MKKIIILLAVTVSFYICKAQTVYSFDVEPENMTSDNYYIKDLNNEHDAIIGTWKWEEGNSTFEITLQEFQMYNYPENSTRYYDAIFGKYKYIENGNLIAEVNSIQPFPNSKLVFNFKSSTEYSIVIKDMVSLKSMVGEFQIISGNTATLNLWRSEGVRVNSPGDNGIEFSLPTSISLTKQ